MGRAGAAARLDTVSHWRPTPDRAAIIEEALAAMPSTAENPNEDSYQRGRFDGIMEYQRNIRALSHAKIEGEG